MTPKSDDTMLHQNKTMVRTYWKSVIAAVIATFAAVTPVFTVGALTSSITKSLRINTETLGIALACFFAFTAIGSPFSTRVTQRLTPVLQLTISTFLAGFGLIGLSGISHIGLCILLLIVSGFANSLVQPAVGRILSAVPKYRLSFKSGLVQAALGAGTLPAFLLLQYVAEPYGWRAAFKVGGVIVLLSSIVVFVLVCRSGTKFVTKATDAFCQMKELNRSVTRSLRFWTLGAALGTVGVTGISSFLIPIAIYQGFSISIAASLALTISGLVALNRIVVGLVSDKYPNYNIIQIVGMMLLGTTGLFMISFRVLSLFLAGSFVVVIGLFGWNGLLVATALRLLPISPEKILGWLQVGVFTGATMAPMVFGILMSVVGVQCAILATAVCAVVGAFMIMFGEICRRRKKQNQ